MSFIEKISTDIFCEEVIDSSWESDILDKIAIEEVIRYLIDAVADNVVIESPGVARVLFPEPGDGEEFYDLELSSEGDSDEVWDRRYDTINKCEICSQDELTIRDRLRTADGSAIDSLREHGPSTICGCCEGMIGTPFGEYKFCCNCFLSEKMAKIYGVSMISLGSSFPEEHVCSVCDTIYPDHPGRGGTEEGGEWEELLDGTWVLNGEVYDVEGEVYGGEYENEDPIENNTEIAREIKGTVSEIGENIFDIQAKLSEGEYLILMNLLQKVTNDVNRL
jgi:hypothetical protein